MEGMGKRKQTRPLSVALIVCHVQFLTGRSAPLCSRWETEREEGRNTRNENRREDLYQNPTVHSPSLPQRPVTWQRDTQWRGNPDDSVVVCLAKDKGLRWTEENQTAENRWSVCVRETERISLLTLLKSQYIHSWDWYYYWHTHGWTVFPSLFHFLSHTHTLTHTDRM